jgi:hypothetical protein
MGSWADGLSLITLLLHVCNSATGASSFCLPPLFHDQQITTTASTRPLDAMATGGHTSGDAVAGVTISFTIVAAFCTIMRLYTRFVLNKMGGVDDIFIAIATVCTPCQHFRLPLTQDIGSGSSSDNYHVCTRFVCFVRKRSTDRPGLMHGSQIWYGKASSHAHSSRPPMDKQVVLGQSMDILLCSLLREAGHPITIPSHLSTGDFPESELRIDRIHHRILVLDHLQCYLQLHSRQLLLDS